MSSTAFAFKLPCGDCIAQAKQFRRRRVPVHIRHWLVRPQTSPSRRSARTGFRLPNRWPLLARSPQALDALRDFGPADRGISSAIAHGGRDAPEPNTRSCGVIWPNALCGTTPNNIPGAAPCLSANRSRVAVWQTRLDRLIPRNQRRIGIVWAGRPTHGNDRWRSANLADLAPLAAVQCAASQVGQYFGKFPLLSLGVKSMISTTPWRS